MFENRVPEVIIEERSRHIWKYCWTTDYGCTFTSEDHTRPKIGITQHSIIIILYQANPCNHVYYQLQVLYTLFSPILGDWDRYIGDKWQLQIQLLVVADWLLGINTTVMYTILWIWACHVTILTQPDRWCHWWCPHNIIQDLHVEMYVHCMC